MLTPERTVLVIVDVQEKLAYLMYEKEMLFENLQRIIKGAQVLGIPILWNEQNPEGLGPTITEISHLLNGIQPISKLSFSCCGNERFMQQLKALNRQHVLLAGIEAHVCIYQTSADLLSLGYEVHVIADAISSRTAINKHIGLEKVRDLGASLTTVETALFELLKVAEGVKFKEILKIVR